MRVAFNSDELQVTVKAPNRELTTQEIVMAYQLATGDFKALFVDAKEDEAESANEAQAEHDEQKPHYGEKVDVDFNCPVCGLSKRIKTSYGYRFTICPSCKTKLINRSAVWGHFGEEDEQGYCYRCNEVFKDLAGNDSFGSKNLLDEMEEEK